MKKIPLLSISLSYAFSLAASTDFSPTVSWHRLPGDSIEGRCVQRFIINNTDSVARLCFTQLPQPMKTLAEKDSIVEINAGYYYITSPLFRTDAKDIVVDVECEWGWSSQSWNPESFHAITPGGKADFNMLIGTKELSRLSETGTEWHLRQPGILIEDGKILMNSPYPDAEIHYTLDGTRPALIGSSIYTAPIPLPDGPLTVKAILCKDGKTSVTSFLRHE